MKYIKKDIKDIKPGDIVFYSYHINVETNYSKNFGIILDIIDAINKTKKTVQWRSLNTGYLWNSNIDELEIF